MKNLAHFILLLISSWVGQSWGMTAPSANIYHYDLVAEDITVENVEASYQNYSYDTVLNLRRC